MNLRAAILGLALLTGAIHAQEAASSGGASSHFTSGVEHVALQTIDSTKAIVDLTLSATADRDLDIADIRISRLRLNGMPAFAAAITGPIHLTANQKWISPQPLSLTIYFRDLHSMDPLQTAVKSGAVQVEGEVMVRLQVGLLAQMTLFSNRPVVPVKLSQQIAVDLPGGELGRQGMLLLLSAGDFAIQQAGAAGSLLPSSGPTAAEQTAASRAVSITTSYTLVDATGKHIDATWKGMGVVTGAHTVVTVAEALEPWLYDPELALALHQGTFKLLPGARVMLKTAAGDVLDVDPAATVKPKGNARHETVVLPGSGILPTKAEVAVRADAHNLALLTVKGSLPPLSASSAQPPAQATSVLAFRQRAVGDGPVETMQIQETPDGAQLTLNDVVDSNAIGSPLFLPTGIAGLVQDESIAITWSEVEKALGIKPPA